MNKHDRDNYQFIMSLTPSQFDEWYNTITPDDIDYAMELIKMARVELAEEAAALIENVVEFTEAKEVLGKFTLNGLK
jgi:hypothetical protein